VNYHCARSRMSVKSRHAEAMLSDLIGHSARNVTRSSNPDCREERFDTDDVHHAREVVGEHVERHFSRYLRQRLHQKVRRTHPHLQRGERMLDGFASHTHGLRVLIEPRLRGFDDVLLGLSSRQVERSSF
jgi:hypothetical protein